MMKYSIVFGLTLLLFLLSKVYGQFTSEIIIEVTSTADENAGDASLCYPNPQPGACTLRSAWLACSGYSTTTTLCSIQLPAESTILLDVETYGSLYLADSNSISIVGYGASVANAANVNSVNVNDFISNPFNTFFSDTTVEMETEQDFRHSVHFEKKNHESVDNNGDTIAEENERENEFLAQKKLNKKKYSQGFFEREFGKTKAESKFRTAATDAGLIVYYSDDTTVQPTLMLSNFSIIMFGSSDAYGGAFFLQGNLIFTLDQVSMQGNVAQVGGVIYMSENPLPVVISNCYFGGNSASSYAGAILFDTSNTQVTLVDNIFDSNSVPSNNYGGAIIFNQNNMNAQINGTYFYNNNCGEGGAILLFDNNDHVTVHNCTFQKGYAAYYGGFIALESDNDYFVISDVVFLQGSAGYRGGCVYISQSNNYLAITRSSFEFCSSNQYSGAISLDDYNLYATISDSFFNNSYSSSNGGVMRVEAGCDNLKILRNQFYNSFSGRGSSLYIYSDNDFVLIQDCLFSGFPPKYPSGSDGAIILYELNDNITISRCIMENLRGKTGGGIFVTQQNFNLVVEDSIIRDVTTTGNGCGVYLQTQNSNGLLTNVTIARCIASGNGGGVYLEEDNFNFRILNSQVVHNSAMWLGGGIAVISNNSQFFVAGCNISDNKAGSKGGGIYLESANNNFMLIDQQGYDNFQIIQSQHPYQSYYPTNGQPYIIMSQYVNVPGAQQIIFQFDPLTNVYFNEKLYIYTDETKTKVIYDGTNYPGVNVPPLVADTSSYYVVFQGQTDTFFTPTQYGNNRYGFKLFATPVMSNPQNPSFVSNNYVSTAGGGMYVFIENLNALVVHTTFEGNDAQVGGGLYMQIANTMISLFQTSLLNNRASADGGGLVLLSGHYGSLLQNVTVVGNQAAANGGGLYCGVQNGVGILYVGNTVSCDTCNISHNVAGANGGGIYADNGNILSFANTNVLGNTALGGQGSGVFASVSNQIAVSQSSVANNRAQSCGGIASIDINTWTIDNTDFTSNLAYTNGGGICILSSSAFTFSGDVSFARNMADIGAGIFLSQASMWTLANANSFITMTGNVANLGSAISMKSLLPSAVSMENIVFSDNVARTGGTLYWIYDSTMTSSPPGYNSSSNQWLNNQAGYGNVTGTQAVRIVGPAQYDVTVYGESLNPPLVYSLRDFFDSFIPLNGTTTLYAKLNTSLPTDCEGLNPFLSGQDTVGQGVTLHQGYGMFSNLEAYCAPFGSMYINVQALLGSELGIPLQSVSSYYVSMNTRLVFRNCTIGEYAKNGQCLTCPPGTYSLQPNALSCIECNSVVGIDACESAEIVVSSGYWRRYANTAAVLSCSLPGNCVSGNMTGDSLCATGSTGPLCAVCLDGYYIDGEQCVACSGGGVFNATFIAFLVLFGVLVLAALAIYLFYDRIFATAPRGNLVKAKRTTSTLSTADNIELAKYHDDMVVSESGAPSRSPSMSSNAAGTQHDEVVDEVELSYWELVWLRIKAKYGQMVVKIKIVVSTFQVVISSADVLSVSFPSSFTALVNSVSILNFSLSRIFPIGCSSNYSFVFTLVITTLAPIGLALLTVIAFAVEFQYQAYVLNRKKATSNYQEETGERQEMYANTRDKYLNYFFYLTYLVLPSVTTTIFQTYLCTNIDPDNESPNDTNYYLTADMNISCDSDEYYRAVAYASCMIIVYPIGIPSMYLYLLYQNRQEIMSRSVDTNKDESPATTTSDPQQPPAWTSNPLVARPSSTASAEPTPGFSDTKLDSQPIDAQKQEPKEMSKSASRLAFLWEAYLPEYWYWEVIEATRRLVLTAVLSVCSTGTSEQGVLSILLALIYIKLYSLCNPYAEEADNILAETGQYQVFFTFFCSLVITNSLVGSGLTGIIGALLVLANLSVVVMSFYFELQDYYEEQEALAGEETSSPSDRVTLKSLVLGLRAWVYGKRGSSGPLQRHHNIQPRGTSKAYEAYLQAQKRGHGHHPGAGQVHVSGADPVQTVPKFVRVDDSVIKKNVTESIQAYRDSDDEDDI